MLVRGRLAVMLLLLLAGIARAQTDYRKEAEEKLGAGGTGLLVNGTADGQWEVVALVSKAVDAGKTAADARQDAVLIAEADADGQLSQYLEQRVTSATTHNQKLAVDQTGDAKFSDYLSTHQNVSSQTFMRGVHKAAEWDSADGKSVFVAVVIRAGDIDNAAKIENAVTGVPDLQNRVLKAKSADGHSDETVVRALGQATMKGGDKSKARDAAVFDALELAVEFVVPTQIGVESNVENLQRVHNTIHTVTTGSVKSFSILSEGRSGDQYQVCVEAIVDPSFAGSVELINTFLKDPSVCITGPPLPGLLKKEVVPIQSDVREHLRAQGVVITEKKDPLLTLDAAMARAVSEHASVLIWCSAEGTARAYSVTTGQAIGAKVSQAWITDASFNRSCALSDADAGTLVTGITAYWSKLIFNGNIFKVVITNVTDLHRQTKMFRDVAQQVNGVRAIDQVSVDGDSKTAVYNIHATGSVDKFLDGLFDAIDDSGKDALKQLKLQKQDGNSIYLNFQ